MPLRWSILVYFRPSNPDFHCGKSVYDLISYVQADLYGECLMVAGEAVVPVLGQG